VPTIKVATNTALYEKMKDNMDMNAGTVLTGTESVGEVGERIFAELLRVASGKLSRAEVLGFNDFAIRRIGPSL
jgi:altronate dehydratase large subunit